MIISVMLSIIPSSLDYKLHQQLALKMARPRFVAVESTPTSGLLLILPVKGQKVKGVGRIGC